MLATRPSADGERLESPADAVLIRRCGIAAEWADALERVPDEHLAWNDGCSRSPRGDGVHNGRRRRAVANILMSPSGPLRRRDGSDRGALLGADGRRRRRDAFRAAVVVGTGAGARPIARRGVAARGRARPLASRAPVWSRRRRGEGSRVAGPARRRAAPGPATGRGAAAIAGATGAVPSRCASRFRDASSSACSTSSCLRKAVRLRLRPRGSHQLERRRGVERPRLHQMSNHKSRRARDAPIAVDQHAAVVQAARDEVEHGSKVLGRVLGRRVVDRHSKIAQLPFKKRRAARGRVLALGGRAVYDDWMFRRRSAARSLASFRSPR